MAQVEGSKFNRSGSYLYEMNSHTPRAIVDGLFGHLTKAHPGLMEVRFTPYGFVPETQAFQPLNLYEASWYPPTATVEPLKPYEVVLDANGGCLYSRLSFKEGAYMVNGTDRYWDLSMKDLGRFDIWNNALEFQTPPKDRNGSVSLILRSMVPSELVFNPEQQATRVGLYITGGDHCGPLVRSMLGYLGEIAPESAFDPLNYRP